MRAPWPAMVLMTVSTGALAQECPAGSTCVPPEDMDVFVRLLRERKCLQDTKPTIVADPIIIVTDEDGRVFASGGQPKPYRIKVSWCPYEIEAQGKVDVVAARMEPPTYAFRFRPKAYLGLLVADLVTKDPDSALDAGLLGDVLFWRWLNLDAAIGARSVGAVVGIDITPTSGSTWGMLPHGPAGGPTPRWVPGLPFDIGSEHAHLRQALVPESLRLHPEGYVHARGPGDPRVPFGQPSHARRDQQGMEAQGLREPPRPWRQP